VTFEQVNYEAGRVARITLDRPDYRNAQSAQLLEELDDAFRLAARDPAVKVIVMAGAGEAFSSGHDLGTPDQRAWREEHARDITEVETQFEYSWDHFIDLSLRWRDIPKPTIAMVHGWCIFGGWLIASAMDLIVAADDARFMTALLQYFPLPYDVGPRKAKELLFDNHEITAAEAAELGFVNRVVPADDLESETMAMAERIAGNGAFYLRMVKLSANQAQDAMGFRGAVVGAHSHYPLSQLSNAQWQRRKARAEGSEEPPSEFMKRMPLVDRILKQDEDGS
jgi:enoyl-CoA hydratase